MEGFMRKVKLFIASSLDGFIAGEDGSIDWLFDDADYGYAQFYDSIDAVLVGRKTYEQAAGFGEYPFRGKQVYVFTRSPGKKDGNVEFVADAAGFTQKMVGKQGGDAWLVGGAEIITSLLNAGLVDEIILSIHPVILGKGIPLFKDIEGRHGLKLVDSKAYPSGLAQLRYKVVHA
ncbi:MAG: dihydrofolate reductase family protein [Nitrososphaera sp.]|uniref:dihydrofolate reductase family protein n=1 Tax=Nitrososphaera sp. TaxID=1971748 RepID=UPI003D6FF85A